MWSLLALQPISKRLYQRPANDNEPGVLVALDGHSAPPVVIKVEETFVSVTFCQTARRYHFGRLTGPTIFPGLGLFAAVNTPSREAKTTPPMISLRAWRTRSR